MDVGALLPPISIAAGSSLTAAGNRRMHVFSGTSGNVYATDYGVGYSASIYVPASGGVPTIIAASGTTVARSDQLAAACTALGAGSLLLVTGTGTGTVYVHGPMVTA